ncbi:hypothetical protein Cgig2_025016 [Carnegiea gigantea]|uniref:Uncharacterized protein n=1 Tax=Carnegiea gigantea TaxID=171969 RepID=A0A9Q1K185_9CARY|nr:hypothetical protein Cgig2_025016 [Carnegiea gigantea]
MASKVNHGLNTVHNPVPKNYLVQGAGADLGASRGGPRAAMNPRTSLRLRSGARFLREEREPARPDPRDEECSTEIVDTIVGGYIEGITWLTWKADVEWPSRFSQPSKASIFPCAKARTLEVDFLVVNVTIACNVEVVITPYLLQLQFEADDRGVDDGSVGQRMASECYLSSIQSLIKRTAK